MKYKIIISLTLGTLLMLTAVQGASGSEDNAITITFSGDILTHKALYDKAKIKGGYDFNFVFRDISKELDGDLNLCHLETPLTRGKPSTYPVFGTPVEMANAIKNAGYDGCSFASNHTLDKGVLGVKTTLEAFKTLGLGISGAKSNDLDSTSSTYSVKGAKVTYLAYTYGTNGIKSPQSHPDIVNRINTAQILREAAAAKKNSDLVIVYLHWGIEYQEKLSAQQVSLGKKLLDSPYVDAVVGSHIHVLQKGELINGKPIIYGMGNFWSGQGSWSGQPRGQYGVIVKLTFKKDIDTYRYSSGKIVSTYVDGDSFAIKIARDTQRGKYYNIACKSISEANRLYYPTFSVDNKCL